MKLAKLSAGLALLTAVVLAPVVARAQSRDEAAASCPGYADHLRNARTYLERSDRKSALAELKRAREALRGCEEAEVDETAFAARAFTPRVG
ncbi:MAG: hypothetical protein ACREQQ_16760 [Candidatus Binatia bacterium]